MAAGQELAVWQRQEFASMLPVLALQVEAADRVLDLCASPGSKTLQLLEELEGGILVANDVSRARAQVVAQRSRRSERRNLLAPWTFLEKPWKTMENLGQNGYFHRFVGLFTAFQES